MASYKTPVRPWLEETQQNLRESPSSHTSVILYVLWVSTHLRLLSMWANLFHVSFSIQENAIFPAPTFSISPAEWCQGHEQVQGYTGSTCCAFSASLSMAATTSADRSNGTRRGLFWVLATGGWTGFSIQVIETYRPITGLSYGTAMGNHLLCCCVEISPTSTE
jgi:hypothetical protein